ncbi:MAG: energy transducer TonB, partial [Ginsengibacter sp.]
MERNQILKSDILDILFDGRNKEYGAYDLRKTYNKRITIALVTTIAVIILFLIGSAIANKLNNANDAVVLHTTDATLQKIKPNEPPPPPPPPKIPPPPPVATIKFTPPKVVKDEEVIKPPPEVKQIEAAKVDVKTVEGTKDLGIVAPPSDLKGSNV